MATNCIETKEEFAENIKYVQKYLELSHQKVADQLGIDRSTYTYYEIAKTEMSVFHLIKLENIFNVYIEDLITNEINIKFILIEENGKKPRFVKQGRIINREYIKNNEELAENLRFFRTNNYLKQCVIADQLFIDRSTYTYYEIGKTKPKLLMLIKIASIFNIEFSELIARNEAVLSGIAIKKYLHREIYSLKR